MKTPYYLLIFVLFLFTSSCFSSKTITDNNQIERFRDHVYHRYRVDNSNSNPRNTFSDLRLAWFEYRYDEDSEEIDLTITCSTGIYEGYLIDSVVFEIDSKTVNLDVYKTEKREYIESNPEMRTRTNNFNKLKCKLPVELLANIDEDNEYSFTIFTTEFYYKFLIKPWDLNDLSELKLASY